MSALPGPFRAALGLIATAIDEVRALPEKAPDLSMTAVTIALQYSLRAQQRYAELMVRGDELVGRIRGVPDEPPPWARFDDDDPATDVDAAADSASAPAVTIDASAAVGAKKAPVNRAAAKAVPTKPAKAGPTRTAKTGSIKTEPTKAAKTGPTKAIKTGPVKAAKTVAAKASAGRPTSAKPILPAGRSGPRLSAFDRIDESAIDDGSAPPND
jgi:hypothetical protein